MLSQGREGSLGQGPGAGPPRGSVEGGGARQPSGTSSHEQEKAQNSLATLRCWVARSSIKAVGEVAQN